MHGEIPSASRLSWIITLPNVHFNILLFMTSDTGDDFSEQKSHNLIFMEAVMVVYF